MSSALQRLDAWLAISGREVLWIGRNGRSVHICDENHQMHAGSGPTLEAAILNALEEAGAHQAKALGGGDAG